MMLDAIRNWVYFYAGIVFLVLAKGKNMVGGYSSPKTFSIDETKKCIEYDVNVVDCWLSHLQDYVSADKIDAIQGKSVLELGPGSDLGIGLYLLEKGASEYNAVDVNNLVQSVPDSFYEEFFSHLRSKGKAVNEPFLRMELEKLRRGDNDKLNYVCRKDFNILSALGARKVDVIVSQAAFEHFDDINETIASLSKVAETGAVAVLLVDLKTHSRWIRAKDPVNIYRYPAWLYRLFYFRGIPNRVRPYQYKNAFERHGWGNLKIEPAGLLSDDGYESVKRYVSKEFQLEKNQMNYLSVWICATKL